MRESDPPVLCRFAHAEMKEIGHDLCVLKAGASANGLVTRSRLFDPFQAKAGFDEQIQPLADGPGESRDLEFRHAVLDGRRRRGEEPLRDLSVEISEIVAHFNRVCQPLLVTQIAAVWRVE